MNREELIGTLEALTSKLIDGAELDIIIEKMNDIVLKFGETEE